MNSMKGQYKKKIEIAIIALLVLVKWCVVNQLPAYFCVGSSWDDAWVVRHTATLLAGNWLGSYDEYTLIKGVVSPLLLALCNRVGLRFLDFETFLYISCCLYFVHAVRPIIRSSVGRITCFTILLFNPLTFLTGTHLRIYRTGITLSELLLIAAFAYQIYQKRNEVRYRLLPFLIGEGIVLWAFMNTREDSLYILPFVIVALLISLLTSTAGCAGFQRIIRMAQFLVPIFLLLCGNLLIAQINNSYYGKPIINDRSAGNYAQVMKDLYLIQPDEEEEGRYSSEEYRGHYYNIYASTLEKAFEASETLRFAKTEIMDSIAEWDRGEVLQDGELDYDHILFAIRIGVSRAGYYQSLTKAEEFYGQVHAELQAAFKENALKKRGISVTPLAAAFVLSDIDNILKQMPGIFASMLKFKDADISQAVDVPINSELLEFERLSGSISIAEVKNYLISGWVFAKNDADTLRVYIYDPQQDIIVSQAKLTEDEGIYQHYLSMGFDYNNAKCSRFRAPISSDINGLIVRICNQADQVVLEKPFNELANGQYIETDEVCFNCDFVGAETSISEFRQESNRKYIDRAKKVLAIYQVCMEEGCTLAFLLYVGMLCAFLIKRFRHKKTEALQTSYLLIASGLLLTVVLFCGLMAYMMATTFPTDNYQYLSGGIQISLIFCGLTLGRAVDYLSGYIKNLINRRGMFELENPHVSD